MGAQSSLNSLTSTIIGSFGAMLDIDKKMGMKAKGTVKQKLATRKEIKKQVATRMGKIGGNQ